MLTIVIPASARLHSKQTLEHALMGIYNTYRGVKMMTDEARRPCTNIVFFVETKEQLIHLGKLLYATDVPELQKLVEGVML